jgi:hypothetical protein
LESSGMQQLQGNSGGNSNILASSQSRHRSNLQRSFLDGSKVNSSIAKDLMNSQPKFTIA